ncbi:MAG: hypothetical protein AAGL49_01345 [Pseudomonadota bacterium]
MADIQLIALIGFLLAAYSIVANDAIQTLGTFLSSNSHRPWWVLWLFACSVLVAVFVYGWWANDGDPAYGRLSKFPEPEGGLSWIHVIPPAIILILTRFGIPVSTTFLVLTVFAPGNLGQMLIKSLAGYAVAFFVGGLVYISVARAAERYFSHTQGKPIPGYWVALQWSSTAFLWSQWLMHDLANIFVYLPRTLSFEMMLFAVGVMLFLHAVIFYRRGGEIQQIVLSKTNTTDIRSATIVDFIYALILLVFKEWSNMPMSTTWVFLGLLAGREMAISWVQSIRPTAATLRLVGGDFAKAAFGLSISVALAFGLPTIDRWFKSLGLGG